MYRRCYSDENINKFQNYLQSLSYAEIFSETRFEIAFSQYYDWFCLLYRLCFPLVRVKICTGKATKWISKGLKKSSKTKGQLRFNYYKFKTRSAKSKYRNYARLLKKCIHDAKRKSNNKYMLNSKNKCKAAWNIIKTETDNSDAQEFIDFIKHQNDSITNPHDIASIFNDHFINSTSNINNKTTKTPSNVHIRNSIYIKPINENDVIKAILSLKNTASVGHDEVCTKVIKKCRYQIAPVLSYLINLSLEQGVFPESLKKTIVKPLFKKGDRSGIENYRPIALISIFSKIFEKIMYEQLIGFFDKFNILKSDQYGFQRKKSTTLATYNLISEVLKQTNDRLLTTVLFFDMTKAFDFVSHNLLISKLENYGIRGPALKWIKSYLDNRIQCTEISKLNEKFEVETKRSKYRLNTSGVPQGSVLGPLLFLAYINDIPEVTKYRTILFADDISIVVTSNKFDNISNHENDINNTIKIIIDWMNMNNLQININKTNFMNFNRLNTKLNIKYDDKNIDETNCVKFLGLALDAELKWKKQVDIVCNKIHRFSFPLYKLTKTASRDTALSAYFGYVDSVARYGLLIWGNSTHSKRAFIAQKKCIRSICGAGPRDSCRPLFKKLKVLPLPCLYILEVANFVRENPYLFKKAKDLTKRPLRNPDRLVQTVIPKTALYRQNCCSMCINIFNNLPRTLTEQPKPAFKRSLYKWLQSQNFYSVKEYLNIKFA